jgi:predicted DNA-binding transcriptional regulator AlpA
MGETSDYLTLPETLARTGLPRATYYAMRARGEFPSTVLLGLASRVHRRADVDAWMATRERTAR